MPVRQKLAVFGDELGEYLLALFHHWGPLVSGAVIGLISWGYGVKTGQGVPATLYLGLLVAAAIVAGFLAWRDERERRRVAEETAADSSGFRLYFIAGPFSSSLPSHSDGIVGVFQLTEGSPDPNTIGSVGMIYDEDRPRQLSWDGHTRVHCIRCELTNHSDMPLVNVTLEFQVSFREALKEPSDNPQGFTWVAGTMVHSGSWHFGLTRLLVGHEKRAVFYICNARNVFMTLRLPEFATAETMDDPKPRRIRLPRVQYPEIHVFNVAEAGDNSAITTP